MSERRRRWGVWLVVIAAAIAALLYARCGDGFGLGGLGAGDLTDQKTSPQPLLTTSDAAAPRCHIRVDAAGVTLEGAPIEIADIAGRCRAGVELTVTGDARYGDAQAVREAVRAAGIDLLDRR